MIFMKKIILNNKSYQSFDEAVEYKKYIDKINIKDHEIILFPNISYISMYKSSKKRIGAQNFYSYNYGSYTGEINLESLKSMNINYVMVGHSERKKYGLDNYEQIKDKLFKSINANFNVLLCIGELKETKNPLKYIKKELDYLTKEITEDKINNLSVAYEPSWAIGTGETPEIEDIGYIISEIKKYVYKRYNKEVEVFYGGSIDEDNIKEILLVSDGVLIGKKSAFKEDLEKIIKKI